MVFIQNRLAKDACFKAAETGNCQNYEARWYFDTKEERCRQFYYGGCGGNDNNFVSEDACLGRCERKELPPPQPQQPQAPAEGELEPFRQEHCLLQSDTGPCRALQPRYFYDSQTGVCDVFGYGGCGGNQNNFQSAEDCENRCGNVQNLCGLPAVRGRCQENVTRYYYESRNDECLPFEYSGCRGNKNNFYSVRECESQCKREREQEPEREREREPEREPEREREPEPEQRPDIEDVNILRIYSILCVNEMFE